MCCVRDVTSWGGGQSAVLKRPKTMSAKVKQKFCASPASWAREHFCWVSSEDSFPPWCWASLTGMPHPLGGLLSPLPVRRSQWREVYRMICPQTEMIHISPPNHLLSNLTLSYLAAKEAGSVASFQASLNCSRITMSRSEVYGLWGDSSVTEEKKAGEVGVKPWRWLEQL